MGFFNENEVAKLLAEASYYALKKGDYAHAQLMIQALQKYRPNDALPVLLQGMFQFAIGKFSDAERTYRTYLEEHPETDMIEVYLAETLIALKRWGDAERRLKSVLDRTQDEDVRNFAQALYEGLRSGMFQKGS